MCICVYSCLCDVCMWCVCGVCVCVMCVCLWCVVCVCIRGEMPLSRSYSQVLMYPPWWQESP